MKKSIIISVVLLLILSIATTVNAYSTSEFEIDIPDSFKKAGTNVYVDGEGRSFNITTVPYNEKDGDPYNQRSIDKMVNELKEEMNLQDVFIKEITRCTKNNHKCAHIQSSYPISNMVYYIDQYAIVSGNKIYTLTLSALNKEDLNSGDLKNVLDSFTIKNYKEPKSTMSPTLICAIIGAGVGVVLAIVSVIKKKKENQAQ